MATEQRKRQRGVDRQELDRASRDADLGYKLLDLLWHLDMDLGLISREVAYFNHKTWSAFWRGGMAPERGYDPKGHRKWMDASGRDWERWKKRVRVAGLEAPLDPDRSVFTLSVNKTRMWAQVVIERGVGLAERHEEETGNTPMLLRPPTAKTTRKRIRGGVRMEGDSVVHRYVG